MVGVDKIATVYAQSLTELARDGSALEGMTEELDAVVGALTADPAVWKYLKSPIISGEDKLKILDKAIKPHVRPLIYNFIGVLAARKRIDQLPGINTAFRLLTDREMGRRRFQVTTAVAMEGSLQNELQKALTKAFNAEAVLELAVNPEIIGGVVIESEDITIDSSIKSNLEKIRRNMIKCNISGEGFYEN